MSLVMCPLKDLLLKVDKWNPVKDAGDKLIKYIDLSSVDKDSKQIICEEVQEVMGNKAPSRARQLVSENDILVATVRPNLNGVASVPNEFEGATASTGYCVLRVNEELLDSKYLFYWVQTDLFVNDMISKASGANYPAVSDKIIKESKIPLPPLNEQKRIAAILDKADVIRQKRKQAIDLADEFLRSVFLDMFGDPVMNPKGWDDVTLGDVIYFAKDGPHVSPKYATDGVPFLSTRHIKSSGVLWKDLKFITTDEALLHWKKCKPELGDILYTKGGTTGIACPVDFEKDFAVWVHVALLRPNPDKVNYLWLSYMLNTQYCYQQSQRHTRGATNKDLGLTRMINIRMFCPPLEEQQRFVDMRNHVLELQNKEGEFEQNKLFESLSQKAFSGQL